MNIELENIPQENELLANILFVYNNMRTAAKFRVFRCVVAFKRE